MQIVFLQIRALLLRSLTVCPDRYGWFLSSRVGKGRQGHAVTPVCKYPSAALAEDESKRLDDSVLMTVVASLNGLRMLHSSSMTAVSM